MGYTTADIPVSLFVRHLGVLSHILKKGEEFAKEKGINADDITQWKLIDDMKPLAFQIESTCNTVRSTNNFFKLGKLPRAAGKNTLEELHQLIADTVALLQNADRKFMEDHAESAVHIPVDEKGLDFTALQALQKMAIPNFYFHASMAYAILRAKGVDVGKDDWMKGGVPWSSLMD
jgi:hypothetical protein